MVTETTLAGTPAAASEAVSGGTSAQPAQAPIAGKRVLVVMNTDSGGGVEALATELEEDLIRRGATVQKHYIYSSADISVFRKIAGIGRVFWTVLRSKADMLITFQPTSSVVATLAARLSGCAVRIVHQSNLPSITHPLSRGLDRLAGSTGFYSINIMNSAATDSSFAAYPSRYRRHSRLIPHGIPFHPPRQPGAAIRAALGLPDGAPLLLAVARLSAEKSIETVIAALPHLPNVHLAIAGEGSHADVLRKAAADADVTSRVHFLGFVPHQSLADYYGAADLLVSPSRHETFGMAVVEAASHALPVLASPIPATREVLTLENGTPAVFLQDWEVQNWVAAIRSALADPGLRQRAEAFAPAIRDRYSLETMLRQYRALYRELLS